MDKIVAFTLFVLASECKADEWFDEKMPHSNKYTLGDFQHSIAKGLHFVKFFHTW